MARILVLVGVPTLAVLCLLTIVACKKQVGDEKGMPSFWKPKPRCNRGPGQSCGAGKGDCCDTKGGLECKPTVGPGSNVPGPSSTCCYPEGAACSMDSGCCQGLNCGENNGSSGRKCMAYLHEEKSPGDNVQDNVPPKGR